jgi:GTPase SAR1 family protein
MKTTVRAMGEDKEFNCIKIVVVGDVRCGKTSLIHRFINDKFPEVFIPSFNFIFRVIIKELSSQKLFLLFITCRFIT